MELGKKVCSRCGREMRPGSTRCTACNIYQYRRTPRLIVGFFLVLLFFLFCGAIYYLTARQGARILAWSTSFLIGQDMFLAS